ncbi:MAG: 2-C-methyl-D-erythritol 4-phosphate cytidylyltransferase [bacterium]|nr:2-C-methyl-D-erythritol 4-phosphate cytidylyltransferase [bacterium]
MSFTLLMPAAGSGVRLGADRPKALMEIAGIPLFVHAIRPFFERTFCSEAVIAAPREALGEFQKKADEFLPAYPVRIVAGGAVRQESVANALAAVTGEPTLVLIHDAARPMIRSALISRVLDGLDDDAAAVIPVIPVTDTVKRIERANGTVLETVARDDLAAAQTPQLIRREIAVLAQRMARDAHYTGTDDVSLLERFHLGAIRIVAGDPDNFKVTTAEDFQRARLLLETR